MKNRFLPSSATSLSIVLAFASVTAGCAFFERADASNGETDEDGMDDMSSGGSTSGSGGNAAQAGSGNGEDDPYGDDCPFADCGTGGGSGEPSGQNLITNGDFASGAGDGWNPNDNITVVDGRGCQTAGEGMTATMGWGTDTVSVTLEAGDYVLSYDVISTSGTPSLAAVVGSTQPPYDPAFTGTAAPAPATLTPMSHEFNVPATLTQEGLRFDISVGGTVCVDNVSLAKK